MTPKTRSARRFDRRALPQTSSTRGKLPAVSEPSKLGLSDIESERQLLGGLLNWPNYIPLAVGIEADFFVGTHHAALWEALAALHREGLHIALIPVWQRIVADGHAQRFSMLGSEAYLVGLTTLVARPDCIPDLIRVVTGEASRRKLALSAPDAAATDVDPQPVESTPNTARPSGRPPSQARRMLALFEAHYGEAFRSLDDRPFVCLTEDGRRQTMNLIQTVKALARWHYRDTGEPLSARTRDELSSQLAAMADAGVKRSTWLRVGEHGGALYLDLGDETWRAVRITRDGWQVIDSPSVYFVRPSGMLPLPSPERGGSVQELFQYANLPDRSSQALALGWLIAALRPLKPLPLLALHGEQGSAKSTTARMLASVVDPHGAGLRIRPKDEQTVMVSAMNAWVLAYDNLSTMPAWLSDLLCCLSTGASYTARTLYTDAGESVMRAQRPVLLTSIEDIASRSDLLDRTLVLTLPSISDGDRRTEQLVWEGFRAAHPRILGALLDAAVHALRTLPDMKPGPLPRMADFARWGSAAERGLGLSDGEFLAAYRENRREVHGQALDASPIVEPLERFMATHSEWTGTASDLLTELDRIGSEPQRVRPGWPKDAVRLSCQIQRLAPNLRSMGLAIGQRREAGGHRKRLITISKVRQ